jgi:hypothetical protein
MKKFGETGSRGQSQFLQVPKELEEGRSFVSIVFA